MTFFKPRSITTAGTPTTAGAPTDFMENYGINFEGTLKIESQLGLEYEFYEADQRNLRDVERLTGETLGGVSPYQAGELARVYAGELTEPGRISRSGADEIDVRLSELKKQYPQIKTRRELFDGVRRSAREVYDTQEDVASRATFTGVIGGFAGDVAGSFSRRDPLNLATLGIGGVGKTAAVRILSEAGANSAIDALNEFIGVSENKRLLGIPNSTEQMLINVAAAGVGAGILRGVGELAAPIAKEVARKAVELSKLRPSEILSRWRESVPLTSPSVKAVDNALEREVVFQEKANPLGDNFEAHLKHERAIVAAERALDGIPRYISEVPLPTDAEVRSAYDFSLGKSPYFEQARQIEFQMREAVSGIDVAIEKQLGYKPTSISQFVKQYGGITDLGGELRARDITNSRAPGLIRRKGRDIDEVRQAVFDAGYFPSKNDYNEISDSELFDAISNDVNGDRVLTFDDQQAMREIRAGMFDVDDFARAGFTPEMDLPEIIGVLEQEGNFYPTAAYRESIQPEALTSARDAAEYYGTIEEQQIQADYVALKNTGKGDIFIENANGEIVSVPLAKILADIDADEAVLNAFRTCAA